MLDAIDVKILNILQKNGRVQRNRIAEAIDMTIPAVSDRIKKLENNGIIKGYYTEVDHKKLGKNITAFVHIFYSHPDGHEYKSFLDNVEQEEDVLECYSITGNSSHILKVHTATTESLEHLLNTLQAWEGVEGTKTYVALSNFKNSHSISPTEDVIK